MATSIAKYSKSFFVKLLVGIIILPFVFWGMGDVFSGGNQNVIATIDSKKISTQEFVEHLRKINLNEDQVKNLPKSDLVEKILSEYIGRKVMALEIEELGITVNDNSLRSIIKNDKLFFKNDKFSRTEYEKFLLKSGMTAPTFESNIVKQESRRQLLSSLSGGIVIPKFLVEKAYNKENQIKTIKFINLEKYYLRKKPAKKEVQEIYNKNKEMFTEEFKIIQYAEISPQNLTGNSEYDENFFRQLDDLENKILDGETFNAAVKKNNLKVVKIEQINSSMKHKNKAQSKQIDEKLFKKVFSIKNTNSPELIKIGSKYFLAEVLNVNKEKRKLNDPEVFKIINTQLEFQNKIQDNSSLLKDISMGGFDNEKLTLFAKQHNLEIKDYKVSDLKQNDIFSEGVIKRIFLTKDKEINLITNSNFTKNYLIFTKKTEFKKMKKDKSEIEKYEAKARLELINNIYKIFDDRLNQKYKVKLNQRTIERVKNSF
tara:strand:- start:1115 stop:2569 length:1455 start_codon:yes stop_codon:yes gene_type:complete